MAAFATALSFLMGLITIVGGVVVIVVALQQRTKRLEMEHRERLAMIERGLVPPPGTNIARSLLQSASRPGPSTAPRHTSLGVAIIGVGLGLMLLIGVAGGAPDAGVGVGGAIAVLGAAFIVNGYLQRGAHPQPPSSPTLPPNAPGPQGPGAP